MNELYPVFKANWLAIIKSLVSIYEQLFLCILLSELPVAYLWLTKTVLLQVKLLDEVLFEVLRPKHVIKEEKDCV